MDIWQKLLLLMIVIVIAAYLSKTGLLSTFEIVEAELSPRKILYLDYRGDYNELTEFFMRYQIEIEKLTKEDPAIRIFTIYYDDVKLVDDPKTTRCAIGFFYNKTAIKPAFLKRFPEFQEKLLPTSKVLRTLFPYFDTLSGLIIQYRILPSLFQKVVDLRIPPQEFVGVMEIFHTNKDGEVTIEFVVPYGLTSRDFFLTEYPAPRFKDAPPPEEMQEDDGESSYAEEFWEEDFDQKPKDDEYYDEIIDL
eukprot:TRINITY_DN11745_c0_g1_i1.p2 TRINITY_DN11745_c0_g1~~TRINITY_DN11745_c0_g1_i1.p2  ORF type:complete len:249 (-),score=61.27 TRINITY_DN11745_c0_g1_i1:171-917(-)